MNPHHPSRNLGSVTQALIELGKFDQQAAQLVWNRFFERLCRFAQSRILPHHQRLHDGGDIASQVMTALMLGIQNNKFGYLKNRDQLWQLLCLIAVRKVANEGRKHDREKRGGGKVAGESQLNGQNIDGFVGFMNKVHSPNDLEGFEKSCEELLAMLPDDSYRKIALLRLQGYTDGETAKEVGCARRTVERKLETMRLVWEREN